jgi:ribonuclease T2
MAEFRTIAVGLLAALCLTGTGFAQQRGVAARFDHWILALSWSPSYCASRAGARDRQQCGPGRHYAFVVHGLWPQYQKGWPVYCLKPAPYIAGRHLTAMRDIMPSRALILHQWRKHGTCSGLDANGYFGLTRNLFKRIKIPARYLSPRRHIVVTPDRLKRDFLKTNVWLAPDMLSLHCGNRRDHARLREIRLCFSRAGNPIVCPTPAHLPCRAQLLDLPPLR